MDFPEFFSLESGTKLLEGDFLLCFVGIQTPNDLAGLVRFFCWTTNFIRCNKNKYRGKQLRGFPCNFPSTIITRQSASPLKRGYKVFPEKASKRIIFQTSISRGKVVVIVSGEGSFKFNCRTSKNPSMFKRDRRVAFHRIAGFKNRFSG